MRARGQRKHAFALGGAILLAALFFAAAIVGALDAHAPLVKNVASGLDPAGMPLPPSLEFPFGTDALGRCVAARLAYGARITLFVALVSTAVSVALGATVGFFAGYAGGRVDAFLMRATDALLSFPLLLLGVGAALALRGRAAGIAPTILVLGFVAWPGVARIVRARVRVMREEGYVEAARALGARPFWIIRRHLLPGLSAELIVLIALSVPQMILAESTLAFLGLGAPAPLPAWGRMLAEGQAHLRSAPWITIAPGLTLVLVSLGFGLLGEGLRDALRVGSARQTSVESKAAS